MSGFGLCCNWLLMMERCLAVGLYCSDVSGAFDRVRKERLILKLRSSGLHRRVMRFLKTFGADSGFVFCMYKFY